MSNFDYNKIKGMEYNPKRKRLIGKILIEIDISLLNSQ